MEYGSTEWAVAKLKSNNVPDEAGVVAELLKHVPKYFLQMLLILYDHGVRSGMVPTSWKATIFTMLPKKK